MKHYITISNEHSVHNSRQLGIIVDVSEIGDAFKLASSLVTFLRLVTANETWRVAEVTEQRRRAVEYIE
jgi:hypothetical protein